jgi:hypothetical protein
MAARTTVVFAFRERGVLSLDDPSGTVRQFFRLLREVHGIESRQVAVPSLFGDGEEGYRLFVLTRRAEEGGLGVATER